MADTLTNEERKLLLLLARQAIEISVRGENLPPLENFKLTDKLKQKGATFVTLTKAGNLRGCIGALEPYLPLAEDVREHAVAAATQDYRFSPLQVDELTDLKIEISRLTSPQALDYRDAEDLIRQLKPGIDGVILRDGGHRATFLPQVWKKIPDPGQFLSHLCNKMGVHGDLWRWKKMQVFTYQVEEFHE
jgi:AmmeMemoRadiSam system protein A